MDKPRHEYAVEMVVNATVTSPDEQQMSEADVVSCAMSAVECGKIWRQVGNGGIRPHQMAVVLATVKEIDCDVLKGQEFLKATS